MELLTSILSKDFIDLAPPDANAPEEGIFLFLQGISVQNDKYKIIIKVGSSYIRKHLWWLACYQESTIWVWSKTIALRQPVEKNLTLSDFAHLLLLQQTYDPSVGILDPSR